MSKCSAIAGSLPLVGTCSYVKAPGAVKNVKWLAVLYYTCLLIPFYEPRSLGLFVSDAISQVLFWGRIISVGIMLVMCLYYKRMKLFTILGISVSAVVLLSTYVNSGLDKLSVYAQWVYDWLPLSAGVLIATLAYRKNMKELLWAVLILTSAISFASVVFIVVFRGGLYASGNEPYMFFGHKNISIYFIMMSIGTSILLPSRRRFVLVARTFALFVAGLFQCTVAYSATSVLALVIFGAMLFAVFFRRFRRWINALNGAIAYSITFFAIIVFHVQTIFAPFIEGVMHKTTTFTGRTFVWDGVLSMMHGPKILLGYGTSTRFHLNFNDFQYSHPHNEILSVLLSGGLIALVLYLLLVLAACFVLFKNRASFSAAVWSSVVVAFMVVAFAEPLYTISWGLALAVGYYGGATDPFIGDC